MVDKNICKTKISAVELTALIILYVNHYNKFTLIQHQVLTRCRHWWDTAYQSFGEFGMNQSKTVCYIISFKAEFIEVHYVQDKSIHCRGDNNRVCLRLNRSREIYPREERAYLRSSDTITAVATLKQNSL